MRAKRIIFFGVVLLLGLAPGNIRPAAAAPIEELYVVLSPFGAPGSVTRLVPRSGAITQGAFSAGTIPNDIEIRGRTAYVASSGTNGLVIADLDGVAPPQEISLSPERNPWGVAVGGGRAYVSNLLTNSVSVVDLAQGTAVTAIPVGKSPEGLLLAGDRLYVANSGFDFTTFSFDPGSVSVIDLGTATVIDEIATGLNPQALALDALGRVHAVCTGDYFGVPGEVDIIDPATLAVSHVTPIGGAPGSIAIDEDGRGYLASYSDGVLVYDALTGAAVRDASDPVDVGGFGASAVLPAHGGGVWVAVSDVSDALVRVLPDLALGDAFAVGDSPASIARARLFDPPPAGAEFSQPAQRGAFAILAAGPVTGDVLVARLSLPAAADVALALFDVTGRRLLDSEPQPLSRGAAVVPWDLSRAALASGRYFLRAQAGADVATRAVLVVR